MTVASIVFFWFKEAWHKVDGLDFSCMYWASGRLDLRKEVVQIQMRDGMLTEGSLMQKGISKGLGWE